MISCQEKKKNQSLQNENLQAEFLLHYDVAFKLEDVGDEGEGEVEMWFWRAAGVGAGVLL